MESSLYTEDLEVNHLLFHFINLANENNDCICCILVHLISFMFIAIYLAFHRIRVAFPLKFISKSVTGRPCPIMLAFFLRIIGMYQHS